MYSATDTNKQNWARRYAGNCLSLAGVTLLAPGFKFVVDFGPDLRIKMLLDNAVWPAAVAIVAACYFGRLQWNNERLGK